MYVQVTPYTTKENSTVRPLPFEPKTAEELQKIQREFRAKLQTVAAKYTPLDVQVKYNRGQLAGAAWPAQRTVLVPPPTTRRRLFIYLCQVVRVILPPDQTDFHCEIWAHRVMAKEGVPYSPSATREPRKLKGKR
jgi:hypothetical protein